MRDRVYAERGRGDSQGRAEASGALRTCTARRKDHMRSTCGHPHARGYQHCNVQCRAMKKVRVQRTRMRGASRGNEGRIRRLDRLWTVANMGTALA